MPFSSFSFRQCIPRRVISPNAGRFPKSREILAREPRDKSRCLWLSRLFGASHFNQLLPAKFPPTTALSALHISRSETRGRFRWKMYDESAVRGKVLGNKVDAVIWPATPSDLGVHHLRERCNTATPVSTDGVGDARCAVCDVQCIAMHRDTKPLRVFTELHHCVVARLHRCQVRSACNAFAGDGDRTRRNENSVEW